MASVTKKAAEVTYVLELSKREAEALTELLVAANHEDGEGDTLCDIYFELANAGAESQETFFEIRDDEVIVKRGVE